MNILVCTALITCDVILRNAAGKSIVGTTELVSLLLLPIFTCALGAVQAKRGHVILEFATDKAPALVKLILDIFGAGVGLFLFASISKRCVLSAVEAFVRHDTGAGVIALPVWPIKTVLAVVVVSMVVRLTLDLLFYLCQIGPTVRADKAENA